MIVSDSFIQTFPEWVPERGLVFSGFFYPFNCDSPGLISAVNFELCMENVQNQTIQLVFCFLCVVLTKISCLAKFQVGGDVYSASHRLQNDFWDCAIYLKWIEGLVKKVILHNCQSVTVKVLFCQFWLFNLQFHIFFSPCLFCWRHYPTEEAGLSVEHGMAGRIDLLIWHIGWILPLSDCRAKFPLMRCAVCLSP